ncbi:metallophosphoesterase, partial [archaeon]|nr:metallophosphoesterase [archaeon]
MKQIALLSDTHSVLDKRFIPYLNDSDEIWHAGDIGTLDIYDELCKLSKVRAVYGNIDNHKLRIILKPELLFKCEEVNIFMTHIVGYPGKYSKGIIKKIEKYKPNLIISGHSHILKVMNDKKNNLLFMNPGAAGNYGIHQVKTIV